MVYDIPGWMSRGAAGKWACSPVFQGIVSLRHRAGRLGMGGAGVRSRARLNSAHEVRAVAGVLLLSEVRSRCRLGEVIVVVVVVVVVLVLVVACSR